MKKTITLLATGLIMMGSAQAQLANGGMEQWHNYSVGQPQPIALEVPNSWYSLDSTVGVYGFLVGGAKKQTFKSTDKHGGTYAAQLISKDYGSSFGVLPGVLSNARINVDIATQDFSFSGGTPVNQRYGSLEAWVKYIPKGNDSALIGVGAVIAGIGAGGADSIIGEGFISLGSTPTYTKITVPITYLNGAVPSHIQVGFVSGDLDFGVDSSMLFVDDAAILTSSGVRHQLFRNDLVSCYPNPASNMLNLAAKDEQVLIWEATTANGQIVARKEFSKSTTVPLNNMPAGIYFYRVLNVNKEMLQTGKFIVE